MPQSKLTLKAIKERTKHIKRTASWSDKEAHSMEDALYLEVLYAIAVGQPNAQSLAEKALETTKINFNRACAEEGYSDE